MDFRVYKTVLGTREFTFTMVNLGNWDLICSCLLPWFQLQKELYCTYISPLRAKGVVLLFQNELWLNDTKERIRQANEKIIFFAFAFQ
jgi:hypothetical protein